MHEFFSYNFPLREYFFCTPPAPPPTPPIRFLMACPLFTLYHAVADLVEGPGGAAPQLFLDQTEARTAEFFFLFFVDRIQKRT